MAKATKPIDQTTESTPEQEFVETPVTNPQQPTIEVLTGEVVVKVVATGDEFTTSKSNWNSLYKNDVVSEGVYKYELVEEKKKLLS